MIKSHKQLKFYIKADAIMNEQVFPHGLIRRFLFPSLIERFMLIMRKTEYYQYKRTVSCFYAPIYVYYRIRYHYLSMRTGFDIPLNTLGYGCRIGHLSPIIINGNTKIGNYCSLSNNIVFADGCPKVIGNDVFIGSNVVFAKSLTVADGCKISSCSFLNKSAVEVNILWGGLPANAIKKTTSWTDEEPYKTSKERCEHLRMEMFGVNG